MNSKLTQNKYSLWYIKLCDSRQSLARTKGKDEYFELHHILPKSMGGDDSPNNLVLLTGREHMIAHILLTKCTAGSSYRSMIHAAWKMSMRFTVKPRVYEKLKSERSRILSMRMKGSANPMFGKTFNMSDQHKNRISKANRGKVRTTAQKNAQSSARKGDGNPFYGRNHSKETIEKMLIDRKDRGPNGPQSTLTCPNCGLRGGKGNLKRYHFDKCKIKYK